MKFKIVTNPEMNEVITEDYARFEYGYFYPAKAESGVGARAIMERGGLSLVSGRVSFTGKDKDEDKVTVSHFSPALNGLREFVNDKYITSSETAIIHGESEGYEMLATPNGSYGYMYVSFWKK